MPVELRGEAATVSGGWCTQQGGSWGAFRSLCVGQDGDCMHGMRCHHASASCGIIGSNEWQRARAFVFLVRTSVNLSRPNAHPLLHIGTALSGYAQVEAFSVSVEICVLLHPRWLTTAYHGPVCQVLPRP